MTFYNNFGRVLVLRVSNNQIKNSNEREIMSEVDEYVGSRLARNYVVSFLHFTGDNRNHISDSVNADVRYKYADGFGNLSESNNDVETIKDMLWDWSHVRDSSDEAFEAMATAISKWISEEDKSTDPLLDFGEFRANELYALRAELDYYTIYEPHETEIIGRLSDELRNA